MKKKIVIGVCATIIVAQTLGLIYACNEINKNEEHIKELERSTKFLERDTGFLWQHLDAIQHLTKANFYKRDAMLWLMNAQYNNPEVHKMLADSCKISCEEYRNRKIK